jgi:hypothetical protein
MILWGLLLRKAILPHLLVARSDTQSPLVLYTATPKVGCGVGGPGGVCQFSGDDIGVRRPDKAEPLRAYLDHARALPLTGKITSSVTNQRRRI